MDIEELKKEVEQLKKENKELKQRLLDLEETVSIIKEDLYVEMEFDLEEEGGCAGCTVNCGACNDEED